MYCRDKEPFGGPNRIYNDRKAMKARYGSCSDTWPKSDSREPKTYSKETMGLPNEFMRARYGRCSDTWLSTRRRRY